MRLAHRLTLLLPILLGACDDTPAWQGTFRGTAVLTASQGTQAFENARAEVSPTTMVLAMSPLSECRLDVTNTGNELFVTSGASVPCTLTLQGAAIPATVSGRARTEGERLVLELNIADVDAATGNTGYQSWQLRFTGDP